MPIYEFLCTTCNRIYSFHSFKIATDKIPACPKCGDADLRRVPSSFGLAASTKTASSDDELGDGLEVDRLLRGDEIAQMIVHNFDQSLYSLRYRGRQLVAPRQHGRLYAGRRHAPERRVARALAAPLLPLVLTLRALGAARRVGVRVSPSLVLRILRLSSGWAAGELVGSLRGPGDAVESWR